MRAAVSVLLSSPVPDSRMSYPDYGQTAHDHAALLILLKPIGNQIKSRTSNKIFERIVKSSSRISIVDTSIGNREILFRFVQDHPVENNDWGDFQTHRRLLGLITLGKYENQVDLNELCRLHETLKVKYNATLYDSRAVFLGPVASENINEPPQNYTLPSNFKTRAVFYTDDTCPHLESQMLECLNSLFWILESKRLERSKEKLDKVSLLLAPFEKKDFIGLDLESRNNKKRCIGRITKHLGDLCLQAGLPADALTYYNSAANTLQSINDWLWLGAAYEGLCVTSALILYPNMCRNLSLHRNSSLQERIPEKQRRASQALEVSSLPSTEIMKVNMPNILLPEEISRRYRETIVHYSKYQSAGIIETESSFKAARISIEQNCTLQAASFLNNVVCINLAISEKEKIDRFTTLADLYSSLGFSRKASFCTRLAATRYVSRHNPNPNWQQCYKLMLEATNGFKISLDPMDMPWDKHRGWPVVQIQVINELVAAANRMGNAALATRHLTFLLQTMFRYMSENERKETALHLQTVSQQCEGAPVPLVLDSGIIIPPANLTNIPTTKSFTLKILQPDLRPQRIERIKEDHGPFLFTPINFSATDKKTTPESRVDFLWVEGDICQVLLQLVNPLPLELHVSNMRLLTSGIVFESIPESIILPAEPGAVGINLTGIPKENGDLEILGFSTHTLGIKSNCRLKYIEGMTRPSYCVEVVPALPTVKLLFDSPQMASFTSGENQVTNANISLYGGQSSECIITVTNVGKVSIEMLEILVESNLDASTESKVFKWNDEKLRNKLPLMPGESCYFTLYLYAHMDFVTPSAFLDINSSSICMSQPNSLTIQSGLGSLSSRLSPSLHLVNRQSRLTSSFRSEFSANSENSSSNRRMDKSTHNQAKFLNVIEGQLEIRYSGAKGQSAGYCRVSPILITIEVLPSIQMTHWDVLPAETSSQLYLVLDLSNMTDHEMELHYMKNKCINMEGKESCRIPVLVDRCPFNAVSKEDHGDKELEKICVEHIVSLVDLKWHLVGTELTGETNLSGITFTRDMLNLVRMSPLQWVIKINDTVVKAQEDLTSVIGECMSVGVEVCNTLEDSLHNLTLSIEFYQDYHNGMSNYHLEKRLSIAGSNKVSLPKLKKFDRVFHECRVIFFTSGNYKLDIQCTSHKQLSNTASVCLDTTNSYQIWRYVPPIEITVQ